jgi:hypothetical protein
MAKQKTASFLMHAIRFGGQRCYWRLSDLEEWEKSMIGANPQVKSSAH